VWLSGNKWVIRWKSVSCLHDDSLRANTDAALEASILAQAVGLVAGLVFEIQAFSDGGLHCLDGVGAADGSCGRLLGRQPDEFVRVGGLAPGGAVLEFVDVLDARAAGLPRSALGDVVQRAVELAGDITTVQFDAAANFAAVDGAPAALTIPVAAVDGNAREPVTVIASATLAVHGGWDLCAVVGTLALAVCVGFFELALLVALNYAVVHALVLFGRFERTFFALTFVCLRDAVKPTAHAVNRPGYLAGGSGGGNRDEVSHLGGRRRRRAGRHSIGRGGGYLGSNGGHKGETDELQHLK